MVFAISASLRYTAKPCAVVPTVTPDHVNSTFPAITEKRVSTGGGSVAPASGVVAVANDVSEGSAAAAP